jgi:Asp/Glu/hydantoin racemase
MTTGRALVAVIHATPATMNPVAAGFGADFPEADLWHLLDDRLVKEADAAGGLTSQLEHRMTSLIQYAVDGGAQAVQLACSMYGPVALAAKQPVPVVAADQALFDEVLALKPQHVAVLASLRAAADDSTERLTAALTSAGVTAKIRPVVVEEAYAAASAGDSQRLSRVLAEAAASLGEDVDVVVLAQYSLAAAVEAIREVVDVPVLSGPHLAARALSTAVTRASGEAGRE